MLGQGEEREIVTMIPFSIKNTQYIGINSDGDEEEEGKDTKKGFSFPNPKAIWTKASTETASSSASRHTALPFHCGAVGFTGERHATQTLMLTKHKVS